MVVKTKNLEDVSGILFPRKILHIHKKLYSENHCIWSSRLQDITENIDFQQSIFFRITKNVEEKYYPFDSRNPWLKYVYKLKTHTVYKGKVVSSHCEYVVNFQQAWSTIYCPCQNFTPKI